MLVGISPLMSPELLSTLYRMGHGDEIVLADAHFPGERMGRPVIRADGAPPRAIRLLRASQDRHCHRDYRRHREVRQPDPQEGNHAGVIRVAHRGN